MMDDGFDKRFSLFFDWHIAEYPKMVSKETDRKSYMLDITKIHILLYEFELHKNIDRDYFCK